MSLQVNFFAHFNYTGVGRHCENAFFAISRNRPAGLVVEYVNQTREASVARAVQSSQANKDVTLFFWVYPGQLVQAFQGRRIIWWFFESNRLPHKWIQALGSYDEIWTPSNWAREVLLAHGQPADRVRVIESGVNTEVFRPVDRAHDGFIFLSVGKYEGRKSIDETVEAYLAEFPAAQYPHVQLWLKADFPLFPERVRSLAEKLVHDPRIRVVSGEYTDDQMAELYRSADAFVFPSKAEGFGLPLLEAIASGVPAICTKVSAQSAFLDRIPGLYAGVQYEIAPIVDHDYKFFYESDYGGTDFGSWALPSIKSIRSAMREIYENPVVWKDRAQRAASIVRRDFSWDAIALKAITAIRDPLGGYRD